MKRIGFVIFVVLMFGSIGRAQIAINTTGDPPDASAILDVASTTQGVLLPKLSDTSDIAETPATGLLFYHFQNPKKFYYYDGTKWLALTGENDNGWAVTGNSGLSDNDNFIGTTDDVPLNFRVNNTASGRISETEKNTFFGYGSGTTSSSSIGNTVFGENAMIYPDSAYNTVAGNYSLYGGAFGDHKAAFNTMIGASSGRYINSGKYNTGIGTSSLSKITYASYNVAVGGQALSNMGYINGFAEYETHNVAVGYNSMLYSNPTSDTNGRRNTAIGSSAMYTNSIGRNNTAIGYQALFSNHNGSENTAVGYQALYSNDSGFYNTAVGHKALYGNTNGYGNTALGDEAGNYGTAITTGNYNTFIGYHASSDNPTRYNCIAVAGEGNLNFGGNNVIRVGNSAVTSIKGNVAWSALSDKRVKENVRPLTRALEFITSLHPVTYNFDIKKENRMTGFDTSKETASDFKRAASIRHTGLLAQDVEKAAMKAGITFDIVDKPEDAGGLWGIRYGLLTVPLTAAVQQQQQIILQQRQTIEYLQQEVKRMNALEKEIEQLEQLLKK